MAQVSVEDLMKSFESSKNSQRGYSIKWFSLKNNESAIVRIMHQSINDMDIVDVHEVKINDKQAKVACLRPMAEIDNASNFEESVKKCPFCEIKIAPQRKLYIHLIEYERNEKGEIVAVPKMWERNAFRKTFQGFVNLFKDYGDLSQHIFKITRTGEMQQTSYAINYMPPTNYPESVYKKDDSLFEGIIALKSVVRNYDYNTMLELVTNGFKMEYASKQPQESAQVVNEQIRPYGQSVAQQPTMQQTQQVETTVTKAPDYQTVSVAPQPEPISPFPPQNGIYTPTGMTFDPNRSPAFQQVPTSGVVEGPVRDVPPWENNTEESVSSSGDRPQRI